MIYAIVVGLILLLVFIFLLAAEELINDLEDIIEGEDEKKNSNS